MKGLARLLLRVACLGVLFGPAIASAQNLQFGSSPSLGISPSSSQWGQTLTLSVSVANVSLTASGTFQVAVYLEKTDGTNPVLWTNINFPAIGGLGSAGGTVSITLPYFIPTGLASGSVRIQTVISQNGVSAEAGVVNIADTPANVQFYTSPSLGITPTTAQWGQTMSVPFSLVEDGTAATGAFQLNLYLENTNGTNPVLWKTISVPSMPNYSTYGGTFTAALPTLIPTGLASGPIKVQAVISQDGVSATAGTITVTAPNPDLIGSAFALQQTTATWGSLVGVQFTVLNQSAGGAGASDAKIYISKTRNFVVNSTNSYLLQTDSVPVLAGGQSASSSGFVNVLLPSANPWGDSTTTFYIGMVVDADSQVSESNETNNANQGAGLDSAGPITVTPPQPSLQTSASSVAFGNVAVDGVGGSLGTQTVTLTDTGLATLNVTGISVSGAPFSVQSIISNIQTLTQPVTFPRSVQSSGDESWVVTVAYDPTAVGSQSGTLTVNSNDPTHPALSIPLTGTGVAVPSLTLVDPVAPTNDLAADYGGIVNDGAGGAKSDLTFTLRNDGSGPLTVSQNGLKLTDTQGGAWQIVSITSSTQGAISLASTTKTIAASGAETWAVVVRFDPLLNQAYATGLEVDSNDPQRPVLTATLTGTGLSPMSLSVADSIGSPTDRAMNFGSVHADGPGKQLKTGTVTLKNTGQVALTIAQNGIAMADATNFQVTSIVSSTQGAINLSSATANIAPSQGETWTVTVTFDPATSGALSTQLNILSNDPAQGTVPVALSGNGLDQPAIYVEDSQGDPDDHAIAYGPTLNDGAGNKTATQTLTVSNIGAEPLVVNQNGFSFSSGAKYSVQGIVSSTRGNVDLTSATAADRTLAPASAEIWTVTVAFDPDANSSFSSTLTLNTNDPATPALAIALTGSGVQPAITLQPTQTGAPLYIQAGQAYVINWTGTYTGADDPQVTLAWDSDADPSSGLTTIASGLSFKTGTGYVWTPDPSLVGETIYLRALVQDGAFSQGSYAGRPFYIEANGSFVLLSPVVTASGDYAYQYVYNGKVYTGTATLQAGSNVLTISTPLPGGGTALHQITVQKVDSLLATQGYTYDEAGRIKTYTNGNGIVTSYTYDLAGNLLQTQATNGNKIAYAYDSLKRKTSMTDSTGTTFYDYDDLDRITAVTYSTNAVKGDADDLVLAYEYDAASRCTAMVYPGGERIEYTYDGAGRMITAADVTRGDNTSYTYDATTGLLHSVTRANGVVTTYGYDSMARLNDIQHKKGSTLIAEYAYTLNVSGNATALLTTFPDGSQKQELYTYDGLDRLTQVVYGATATAGANDKTVAYTYDGNGNRLTQATKVNNAVTQTLTYSYGSENRLLQVKDQTGAVTASYAYDAAGNRVQKTTPQGTTYYSYDERNLLLSVVTPVDYVTYAYNGAAQRVAKSVNGVGISFVIDPSQSVFQTVQERNAGGLVKQYVYGQDRLEVIPASGNPEFYLPDRLGSVRNVVNPSGAVTQSKNFDAFGSSN